MSQKISRLSHIAVPLTATLVLLACSPVFNPWSHSRSIQSAASAQVVPPTSTTNPTPSATPYALAVHSDSPDGRYSVDLNLAKRPIELVVLNRRLGTSKPIPLTYRRYNRVVGDGPAGFKWSADGKILMFVLYREPFPEQLEQDFSCFFAVRLESAEVITANYSETFRGLTYVPVESDFAWLEHGGLNDIYDFYFPGANCYRDTIRSECEASGISPSGTWQLSQWDDSHLILTSSSGQIWEYAYPNVSHEQDHPVSFIQRWSADERSVFFSPAPWYSTSRVYGLFRMDLSTGTVVELLGSEMLD